MQMVHIVQMVVQIGSNGAHGSKGQMVVQWCKLVQMVHIGANLCKWRKLVQIGENGVLGGANWSNG